MSLAVWEDKWWWIDVRTMVLQGDDAFARTFRLLSHYGGEGGIAFFGGRLFLHLPSIPVSTDSLSRWESCASDSLSAPKNVLALPKPTCVDNGSDRVSVSWRCMYPQPH